MAKRTTAKMRQISLAFSTISASLETLLHVGPNPPGRIYCTRRECEESGHLMDDGSLQTCMRIGCDEGMQMVDYYLDLEERCCKCIGADTLRCGWHNPHASSMADLEGAAY